MAGYLDSYGVADLQRAKKKKQIALLLGAALILGLAGFLFLHNRSEKRTVRLFLDDLRSAKYQDAYRSFGCTPSTPCRDYTFDKFMEDWGPKGQYANVKAGHVTVVDSCGEGVVTTLEFPNVQPFGLYVDRKTRVLSFAPWPRCPGRHWHIMEFLSRQFS
jgi:hypothetical protein